MLVVKSPGKLDASQGHGRRRLLEWRECPIKVKGHVVGSLSNRLSIHLVVFCQFY
jgi:hypothetical protein